MSLWISFIVLILLGFIGEIIFLKSNQKIKKIILIKKIPLPLQIQKSLGLGFFIGGFIITIIGLIIICKNLHLGPS